MDKQAQHIHPLTSLRFFAALLVFLQHLHGPLDFLQENKLGMGGYGVCFFFVLSGFILTYVYAGRVGQGFSVMDFYVRRFARIWPLHFVMLTVCALTLVDAQHSGWDKFLAQVFLVQSWIPSVQWIGSYNSVAWTLSAEGFFYLVFPLLLLGGEKQSRFKWLGMMVVVLALVLGAQYLANAGQLVEDTGVKFATRNPFVRTLEFSAGVVTGYWFLNHPRSFAFSPTIATFAEIIVGLLLVAYLPLVNYLGMLTWLEQMPGSGKVISMWFATTGPFPLFCIAVILFGRCNGAVSRLLRWPVLVYLGEISFAFYMVHQPVLRTLQAIQWDWLQASPALLIAAGLIITLALSSLIYHLVELPMRTALVQIYQRRWNDVRRTFQNSYGSYFFSRPFVATIAVLIGCIAILSPFHRDPYSPRRVQKIVDGTPPHLRNVQFEKDATLLGWHSWEITDAIVVEMVWDLEPHHRPNRFLHICDQAGNLLRSGPTGATELLNVDHQRPWIERVIVPKQQVTDAAFLGIGFYDPETKCAIADRGPRTMGNRRLTIHTVRDPLQHDPGDDPPNRSDTTAGRSASERVYEHR